MKLKLFIIFLVLELCVQALTNKTNNLVAIPNAPKLTLANDTCINLWGTKGFLEYSHIWLLGDTNNLKHALFVLHGNGNSDFSIQTSEDRNELHQDLNARNEGAILIYPVCNTFRWDSFYNKPMDCSLGLVKAFRQLEHAAGRKLKFQQFSLSGSGRVDHSFFTFLLAKYDHDDTNLDIKDFVDNRMVGVHSGESTYNFRGNGTKLRITFLDRFSHVKAAFISDTEGPEPREMQKIGEHYTDATFNINTTQDVANGRIRFWKGIDHGHCFIGHFAKAFGFR